MAEQKEERQPPGQEENGEDPYAGSTDENTDHEGPPESPDLPIPELPGGNPSLLRWGLPCHLSKVTCPRPPGMAAAHSDLSPRLLTLLPDLCHLRILSGLFPSCQHPCLSVPS